jgi:hypothetical protein
LIQTGGNTLRSEIHKIVNSTWKKEELPQAWKDSIIVHIYRKSDETDCSNYRGISLLPTTYTVLYYILVSISTPYGKEIIGDSSVDFNVIGQVLIRYSLFIRYWQELGV